MTPLLIFGFLLELTTNCINTSEDNQKQTTNIQTFNLEMLV